MVTRCFSFGYGQVDPIDGSSQADTYARVTAPTADLCRQVMLRLFHERWAFEYGDDIVQVFAKVNVVPRMKYDIVWGEGLTVAAPTPASAPALPRRHPADYGSGDDEEAAWTAEVARATVLDSEDDGVPEYDDYYDEFVLRRGVDTVELPEGDVK